VADIKGKYNASLTYLDKFCYTKSRGTL